MSLNVTVILRLLNAALTVNPPIKDNAIANTTTARVAGAAPSESESRNTLHLLYLLSTRLRLLPTSPPSKSETDPHSDPASSFAEAAPFPPSLRRGRQPTSPSPTRHRGTQLTAHSLSYPQRDLPSTQPRRPTLSFSAPRRIHSPRRLELPPALSPSSSNAASYPTLPLSHRLGSTTTPFMADHVY